MPAVASVHAAPPSTLAVVLGQVVDAFQAIGDATPIMIGKKYLDDFGVGSAPRVVFVPEVRGKIGPPIEMGNPCSIAHSCNVLVRGAEDGSDLGRFDAAYALGDLVIDLIATAATGRLEWGDFVDDSPTPVDAYGADLALSFTYTRDVRHNARRWALPAAAADTSPAQPLVPPGIVAELATGTATTAPQE